MGNAINLPNITPEAMENLENETSSRKPNKNGNFDTRNYLDVRLEEGQTEKTLKIRLLPMDLETGNPFVKVHTHNVKVPKEVSKSGFKSYICLNKTEGIDNETYGNKCPFCEINREAYSESTKTDDPVKKKALQDISVANLSRETVIVRCIQRGKEDEGVKFWKFNIRTQDKTDPYNQIMRLYKMRKEEAEAAGQVCNILDIYNGRDLNITITEGNAAPAISDAGLSTPLSKDENEMKQWIYDGKKWQDVFAIKPYEYLSIVSQMRIPWYDRDLGKWVDKEEYDIAHGNEVKKADEDVKKAEKELNGSTDKKEEKKEDFVASITVNDEDDLPF
jgi:hypothetical protein